MFPLNISHERFLLKLTNPYLFQLVCYCHVCCYCQTHFHFLQCNFVESGANKMLTGSYWYLHVGTVEENKTMQGSKQRGTLKES